MVRGNLRSDFTLANRNIQMKKKNDSDSWDNLYPVTLSDNVFDNEGNPVSQTITETQEEVNNIYRTFDEDMIATDIQGIDTTEIEKRGERLPVVLKDREVIKLDILEETSVRNRDDVIASIDQNILRKFKDFEIFITNTLDEDIEVWFRVDGNHYYIGCYDPEDPNDIKVRRYGKEAGGLLHVIPNGYPNVKLSDIMPISRTGSLPVDKAPFKKMYGDHALDMHIRAVEDPSSGSVSAYLVGVPN